MDKFYYLAAQLPAVKFSKPSPISCEAFLKEASKRLDRKEYLQLASAKLGNIAAEPKGSKTAKEFFRFELNLRKELFAIRQARIELGQTGRDYSKEKVNISKPQGLNLLGQELISGNPLEVEKNLLGFRWRFLGDLEPGHYFDLDFLTVYFLKLQILERLFSFDKEKGIKVFDKMCEVKL
ncbi:MAG: DUF2764 family protein [Candidatus Omnitrophota bacterium]